MIDRKKIFLGIAAALLIFPSFVRAQTVSGLTGNINGALGLKMLDEDDWDPNDDQLLFGAQFDIRKTEWPISLALDVFGSADTEDEGGVDVEGQTTEIAPGVRKVWDMDGTTLAPFIGFGPAFIVAHQEASVSSGGGRIVTEDDDSTLGFWAGGGLLVRLTPRFNLGAGIRYSHGRVKLFQTHLDAGGWGYMLLAGVHF